MASRFQHSGWAVILLAAASLAALPRPAAAQLQFSSADGKQSFKIGVLGQLQAESIENADLKQDTSNNLFLRRIRLLGNFKLSDDLTVFFDTDTPNLGKGNPDGTKNNADIFIQDFIVTYAFSKAFQLDGGMLLMAQSYNHNQSAATLMAVDFAPYTFIESVPLTARTGRDYGVQARGYLGDDHLEYRAGVFQGLRGTNNTNAFRYAGRLAYYVFGPETTYFYRGTSLGKIQTLSIGGSFDRQQDYKQYGADLFWDQPIAGGDGLTIQADYNKVDGDVFIPALPKQTNTMVEAGYYFHNIHLQPYIQYAQQNFDAATRPDEKRTQGGLAFYFNGHNSNLKLAWTKIDKDGAKKRNQYVLQYQVFQF
ncbi:MAG TPA: hypothetical protein VGH73_10540 [Thermoanaerobaculia bacterium]|jgi:hypothetical protein